MDDKVIIYHAFFDIRSAAYDGGKNPSIIKLSEVFHNIPLQLERTERENGDYSDVLRDIRERARRAKCKKWLDNILCQL